MLRCGVCHAENHHLAVTCVSCGGFLQNRAENLDLFVTSWGVIERPRQAFHTIAISRHKNYAALLSAFSGIGMAFLIFWVVKAGEHADNLLNLLIAGLVAGPVLGILVMLLITLLGVFASRLLGSPIGARNAFAVTAYALIPVALSVILVLPVEVLTFGQYFFTRNPSPYALKPLSAIMLFSLDGICVAWTLILFVVGYSVLVDRQKLKALVIFLISVGGTSAIGAAAWQWFGPR